MVSNLISHFNKVMSEHIRREDNVRADALSRLATEKKKSHHRSIMQICLKASSVGLTKCLEMNEGETWMTPIKKYLEHNLC